MQKNIFFKASDGAIYKTTEKPYVLLMTPSKKDSDRRIGWDVFSQIDVVRINKNVANKEINEAWRKTPQKWEHNGLKFTATDEPFLENAPIHDFPSTYTDKNGVEHTMHDYYRVGMYRGQIVWVGCGGQYLPQLYFFKFEALNKQPRSFHSWTNVKCIKPIFCNTKGIYV